MKDQYNHKYDDIINLPHPTSKKHPRMSLYARAAQFSPFAALTGHEAAIKETVRQTDAKQVLSEEVIEELEKNLNPLKKQADDATKYKNYKHELENIEIAIMAKDITDLNEQYQELKNLVDTLNEDAVSVNATVNEKSALSENMRLQSIKNDEKID